MRTNGHKARAVTTIELDNGLVGIAPRIYAITATGDALCTVWHGDCLNILRRLPDNSVHSIITDPPYGLSDHKPDIIIQALTAWASGDRERVPDGKGFMGHEWDKFVPPPAVWDECYRLLKPGGYMAVFGGARTVDLMGLSIRLAGFELRDTITWMYSSGYPKSRNISKDIDKLADAKREVIGEKSAGQSSLQRVNKVEQGYRPNLTACTPESIDITAPATEAAKQWDGWGTALKPSGEPVIVAQKPLVEAGTLATIGSHLARLEAECTSSARHAAPSLEHIPPDAPGAKIASAPVDAATRLGAAPEQPMETGAVDDSSAATGTSLSASAINTSWNIVASWSKCWTELCTLANMSITETDCATTTDLKTLASCLSQITLKSITEAQTNENGSSSIVEAVDNLFNGCVLRWHAIHMLSVAENATSETRTLPPDGTAPQNKPASEPIIVARKPFKGTVAQNVLTHGTGGINIDGCRVATTDDLNGGAYSAGSRRDVQTCLEGGVLHNGIGDYKQPAGRWPSNLVLSHASTVDGEDACADGCVEGCPVAELDAQSGISTSKMSAGRNGQDKANGTWVVRGRTDDIVRGHNDSGGASRFYPVFRYQAKAPMSERPKINGEAHPTVKPLALIEWLTTLFTVTGGTILDLFAGTGTTGVAAAKIGCHCILIERERKFLPHIRAKLTGTIGHKASA